MIAAQACEIAETEWLIGEDEVEARPVPEFTAPDG